jgi:cysteine-rich repeat protein
LRARSRASPSEDVEIEPATETEATGSGSKCNVTAVTSSTADSLGDYPSIGTTTIEFLVQRGGPNPPEGDCVVSLRARADDGVSVEAAGAATVSVPVTDIEADATVIVDTIVLRESSLLAGVSNDCQKWSKKQFKYRAKCNDQLLSKGPEAAAKCKDEGAEPEPCDPGDHTELLLDVSSGGNDQQLDVGSAQGVDRTVLKPQLKCQKLIGKSVGKFFARVAEAIDRRCVQAGVDSDSCRDAEINSSKTKLDKIAKCVSDQLVDDGTGRAVPQIGATCGACLEAGSLDTKCLRDCLQLALGEAAGSFVGAVPVCGNGVLQPGEFCDDGNVSSGDGCSDSCTVEAGP